MTNNLKIKKYWITTFCLVFFSLFSFAQELSDETIGFNVVDYTAFLKNRGVTDKDMKSELSKLRKTRLSDYLEMKKSENDFLQMNINENKVKQSRSSINSKTAVLDIPQIEKDALLAFYNSTNGSNWLLKKGWDFSTPVTTWDGFSQTGWYGITITDGHVTKITDILNATGTLPDLSALQYLKELYIFNSSFTGNLTGLQNLNNLEKLRIGWSTSSQSSFQDLNPLSKLTNLTELCLHSCNFTNNSIPSDFTKLVNLKKLEIRFGNVNQNWEVLGNLTNLIHLNLGNNNFASQNTTLVVPPNFANLTKLEILDLSNNKIKDISVINNMKELKYLNAQWNEISTIPSGFSELTKLNYIRLGQNKIKGNFPSYLQNLQLNTFEISSNEFEGKIPALNFDLANSTVNYYIAGQGVAFLNKTLGIYDNKFRFIDFANEFEIYKTKIASNYFTYQYQKRINVVETITKGIGQSVTLKMFPEGDSRYLNDDTFKWFKNGVEIIGATERTYTLTNLTAANAATYICRSYHTSNPDMSALTLEREPITLKVVNCTPLTGNITSTTDKFHTGGESNFAFQTTATGLSYEWSVTTAEGTPINEIPSNTLGIYTYTFTNAGDYIVKVKVTDSTGCTTEFTKEITVTERYCDNEPVDFSFETTATNLTYTWTATDSTGRVVNRVTDTTGLYTFTPQVSGEYVIELVASSATSCKTLFTKNITIDQCTPYISCTRDNPLSPEIHRLFINMITKLASAPAGTNVNVYAHKEIAAVAPYTTEKTAKIYNFVNNGTAISFSFTENGTDDVYIPKASTGSVTAIDLSKYVDSVTSTIVATSYSNGTTNNSDGHVKNIDFCPKELSCVSHVALVVDESGSLDQSEINKIKKQLKLFVAQQAFTNDDIGSNIHISITGMSDSDDVNKRRKDFIIPTKVTASNVSLFNNWIEKLGKRYGDTIGISQASDFWKSGLDGALSYSMKPNFVIMITDGAQTDDVAGLKETFKKFDNNNTTVTDPKLPHLYVVGIENGVYIDRNSLTGKALPRNEDPNYNPSIGSQNNLTAKTTPFLTKSLQFLLDLSPTEFPVADINQFTVGTYFGHSNFDLLASDETYFSDKLIVGEVVCGTPAVKDSCDDCFSFKPEPGKEYVLSAWVKEESNEQVKTYVNPLIKIKFYNNKEALDIPAHKIDSLSIKGSGDIIDGWQRVVKKFKIPNNTITLGIELENLSPSIPVYFDDIRIHPLQGSVKSFVYDPETFKLMSELDENNYSTFYEYDNEGGLVRVKKETAKGIKTIQETRSGNVIETTNTTP